MTTLPGQRDGRPSPDALLKVAAQEGRGKLKIFLGAAPGVGKTYAMLLGAQRLQNEGVDVAVGLVETHGRAETAALLEKLVVLPRKPVSYRGRTLMEFDIDGAIARRPKLLIVDELAHSNPPDSRHPKRYQDIQDILAAGIDVWTAINIQHLESLSDVVSRITGVKVRETVPDTVIEEADEVVVVDITPAELIQRLKEGKVYLPENARRAIDRFFTASNLTALRELALRRTADQVDDQMVAYLRQNAIQGPWPTAERLLVCVGGDELSSTVVREAARLATSLKASWVAVNLKRTEGDERDPKIAAKIDETMRLAERLGAETAHLVGHDLPAELLRYAKRENITQIICGRSRSDWLARLWKRSLPDEIVAQAEDIAVHVVAGKRQPARAGWTWPAIGRLSTRAVTMAALAVGVAVVAGILLRSSLELPNLSMLFLTAVLVCAVNLGTVAAIYAAILSFLAYNFFFIEPLYTFTVARPHELFALVMFLLVAVLTGGLAGRVREQSNAATRRADQTRALYEFTRKLSGAAKLDDVVSLVSAQMAQTVSGRSIVLLGEAAALTVRASAPADARLGPGEWAAARSSFERQQMTGWRSNTLPNAQFQFRPLKTSRGILGVIGLQPENFREPLTLETERMLSALIDQAALAVERTILVDETAKAQALADSERLRSALLSSLSHDLRTPLSAILGSVTTLRAFGKRLTDTDRDDLLAAIEEEARRLQRFVANLLDMTRLEAGAVEVRRDWIDLGDAVRAAAERIGRAFKNRPIDITTEPNLPPLRGDSSLIEQMFFNLLDNAIKYSEAGTPIAVHARRDGNDVVITVRDQGAGIPKDDLERVFEKFYRSKAHDGRPAGTGLGLPICRGIATAMGGTIRAESPAKDGKGTRLVVRLPAAEAAIDKAKMVRHTDKDLNDGSDTNPGGR
jgi:two-component system sensor histidine kinase KdpD